MAAESMVEIDVAGIATVSEGGIEIQRAPELLLAIKTRVVGPALRSVLCSNASCYLS